TSEEAATAAGALRTAVDSLPTELQIRADLHQNPIEIGTVNLIGLDTAQRMLNDRAHELDGRAKRRQQLQTELDLLAEQVGDLDKRWSRDVLAPGNQLAERLNGQRDALSKAITGLDIRDVGLPSAPSLADPSDFVNVVQTFRECTDEVIQRIRA